MVATGHEPVATQTDLVATGREPVATQTDPVATQTDPLATERDVSDPKKSMHMEYVIILEYL